MVTNFTTEHSYSMKLYLFIYLKINGIMESSLLQYQNLSNPENLRHESVVSVLSFSVKPTDEEITELKYLNISITSTVVSISHTGTSLANSFSLITGKRLPLTIVSPRIVLFIIPSGDNPCLSHSFVAQGLTAWNKQPL